MVTQLEEIILISIVGSSIAPAMFQVKVPIALDKCNLVVQQTLTIGTYYFTAVIDNVHLIAFINVPDCNT
jgi:hypothetical protein